MPVMLERWNDDKMDVLEGKVDTLDTRVAGVDKDLRELRRDLKTGFERIDERFERLHRLMVQFCSVALAALIGLIATQV